MYSFNKVCSNIIPVGSYKAQITDIKFKTSGTGVEGYDMQVTYTISEGPYAKRVLIDTIYEKAFSFRLMPFLKACGIDTAREFATAKELYNYGVKEALNKFVLIEVNTREYNGNTYNNIKSISPIPGSTTTPEDVLNEFNVEDVDVKVMPTGPAPTADAVVADTEPTFDVDLDEDNEDAF